MCEVLILMIVYHRGVWAGEILYSAASDAFSARVSDPFLVSVMDFAENVRLRFCHVYVE